MNGPTQTEPTGPTGAPGAETHELRFVGPHGASGVPASVLAETLQAVQRVVHLLSMARRQMIVRQRARVPSDIERAFPVLCDVARMGSFIQPIRIGDPAASLFSPAETVAVAEDFVSALDAAVRGDADAMGVVVADAKWRAAVWDGIGRMVPKPSSGISLIVACSRTTRTFDLSGSRQKIETLALRPPATAESRTVIGSLQAIEFGERRMTLRHPKTGRAFDCFYVDDVEPMLLENARQLIQVTGEVQVDAQGEPVKVVETTDIRPVDMDPIPLLSFSVGNQQVAPTSPITLTPELDETEQLFVLQDESIGIDLVAETRAELDEMLAHELPLLWQDYALAQDSMLTKGARGLKARLLAAFRTVPDAA